jgi:hypothetical protein
MQAEKSVRHREPLVIAAVIMLAAAFILIRGPVLQYNGMRLYFPDKNGSLREERRPVFPIGSTEERVREVVTELLLGPVSRDLEPLVYTDVSLIRAIADGKGLFIDVAVQSLENFGPRYRIFKEALFKTLHATFPGTYQIHLYVNGVAAL